MKKPKDIDEYIAGFPKETQKLLEQYRAIIKKSAPAAEEVISYGMPGFRLNGILVWFAGYKYHIGFYPKTGAISAFSDELMAYKTSKGAIQFPLDKPLPVALVKKIVRFRVKENRLLEKTKKKL